MPFTTPTTRLAIIGAGPAGCAAAFHLVQAGFSVTLIESRTFPRPKVCGEFISPAATGHLLAILPEADLRAAGAQTIRHLALSYADRTATWMTPQPGWSLSRERLDSLLLSAAQRAGAAILQPVTVRDVAFADDAVMITLADGTALSTDLIIHADGHGRHDPAGPTPAAANLIGHKCHLRIPGAPESTCAIRSAPSAYIGTIPIEDGGHTCALVASAALTRRFAGNADALLTHLWPTFRPEWRTTAWLSSGVPRSGYIHPGHPRSFRIGNAAAAVDPVGGEGIGLALWSGETLAHAIRDAFLPHASANAPDFAINHILPRVQATFARAYTARLRTRRVACRLTAAILTRPRFVRVLWPLTAIPALTFTPFYRLSGKPRESTHARRTLWRP